MKLMETSDLEVIHTKELTDQLKIKTGESVTRIYTMTKIKGNNCNVISLL